MNNNYIYKTCLYLKISCFNAYKYRARTSETNKCRTYVYTNLPILAAFIRSLALAWRMKGQY